MAGNWLESPCQPLQPDRIVRWIGYPLALLAVFALIGGHWAVLQTVAWAGMLQTYSRTDGLVAGVEKTFSGEHPCKMCLKVQVGKKQEERKSPLVKLEKKAEAFVEPLRFELSRFSSAAKKRTPPGSDFFPSHRDAPLSPPPQIIS